MSIAYITTLGQDSHAFVSEPVDRSDLALCSAGKARTAQHSLPDSLTGPLSRPLMLGGVRIEDGTPALAGNSDADVILHAITNAISGYTGVNILGGRADELCRAGVTDSVAYLQEALETLPDKVWIEHISLSLEGQRPRLKPYIGKIRRNLARLLDIKEGQVGLTATSGEGLTAFGRGEGIQALCLLTLARQE